VRTWTAGPAELGPIHVYRDGGRLIAAHVVPLAGYPGLVHTTEERLLPLFREGRDQGAGRQAADALERRRSALIRRVERRLSDVVGEIAQVLARHADAAGRDVLRAAGDALHTYGTTIPAGAERFVPPGEPDRAIVLDPELDAKANAARYFARYRKATDALPHLERRIAVLEAKRDALEELAFEAGRADAAGLADVTALLAGIEGRPVAAPSRRAARRPLAVDRPSGARIYVGRSPSENVDVTFRLAKPDDLWFHARGIPGSHVVLQAPPGEPPSEADLDCAADLAARHSRAKASPRVEIDFTERKYVRKQRDAAPGMVWYTNARSRVGRPGAVPATDGD
jgi:predicted ribosome quality control (RQC) complex YloA/Tae2 family protein